MAHHIRCAHCEERLFCRNCGHAVDAPDHIPGAVGKRHTMTPFDPTRRGIWARERGRILLIMRDAYPFESLNSGEIAKADGKEDANQTCIRLGELCAQGLVKRTGMRSESPKGALADQWELTAAGLAMFRTAPVD